VVVPFYMLIHQMPPILLLATPYLQKSGFVFTQKLKVSVNPLAAVLLSFRRVALPCVTSLLELVCHGRPDRVQYTISINK
jgi:hypothetical protein